MRVLVFLQTCPYSLGRWASTLIVEEISYQRQPPIGLTTYKGYRFWDTRHMAGTQSASRTAANTRRTGVHIQSPDWLRIGSLVRVRTLGMDQAVMRTLARE
ncbi:hypothetical protein B0H19DRAFT_1133942 [Mycena capillaripes]|nr:hypothetical protein B0H19DRAFT_1133942 [Mycena capillaripes]